MIKVENVTKYYGNFKAVENLNFEVEAGEIVAFLGPNGAGKTTTMRIITGFMSPTAGDVYIGGVDVFDEPEVVKKKIGYLPEHPPLYPDLTVYEYLRFVAELKKVDPKRIKSNIEEALELTGLQDRRNTLIKFLSKGLKQRTGIAQSIVNSPSVLILDEPTVGLDPKQVIDIRKLIQRLAKTERRTIIISTHLLKEASDICEKAIIINNGQIIAVDSINNLRVADQTTVKIKVVVSQDAEEIAKKISKLNGVTDTRVNGDTIEIFADKDLRNDISRLVVSSNAHLLGLSREEDTLEDVFVKLVQ